MTRSVFLEGATLGLGAADRRLDHAAGRRLRGPPRVPRPEAAQGRPRPDREVPDRPVVHRDLHRRPGRGRGRAGGRRSSATTATSPTRRRSSRCRASRSSPTAAPTSAARCRRTARSDRSTPATTTFNEHTLNGPVEFQSGHPGRLWLPVPRRPVRHRGQPHRRPARARARPLRVRDQPRPPVLLSTYSVSHVVGTGAQAQIYKYKLAGPGEHVDGPEQFLYPIQPPHH